MNGNQPLKFQGPPLPQRPKNQQTFLLQNPSQKNIVYAQAPLQYAGAQQVPLSQWQVPQARPQTHQTFRQQPAQAIYQPPRAGLQQRVVAGANQAFISGANQAFVAGANQAFVTGANQAVVGGNQTVIIRNQQLLPMPSAANNKQTYLAVGPQLPRAVSYGQLNIQQNPMYIINGPVGGIGVGRKSDPSQVQLTDRLDAPRSNPQAALNVINNDLYERAQVILQNKIDEIVNETIEKTESIIKYSMTPEKDKSKLNKSFSSSKKYVMTPDYEGEIIEGERDGVGVFHFQSGWKYEGQWEKNYKNGFGVLFDETGKELYTGDWLRDVYWGHGILRNRRKIESHESFDFTNFDKIGDLWERYEGEFIDGKFDGLGTLYLTNGERYGGKFKKGKVDGEGTFYSKPAKITIGVWENNKLQRII